MQAYRLQGDGEPGASGCHGGARGGCGAGPSWVFLAGDGRSPEMRRKRLATSGTTSICSPTIFSLDAHPGLRKRTAWPADGLGSRRAIRRTGPGLDGRARPPSRWMYWFGGRGAAGARTSDAGRRRVSGAWRRGAPVALSPTSEQAIAAGVDCFISGRSPSRRPTWPGVGVAYLAIGHHASERLWGAGAERSSSGPGFWCRG